jgi:nicotinamidase-related amidase
MPEPESSRYQNWPAPVIHGALLKRPLDLTLSSSTSIKNPLELKMATKIIPKKSVLLFLDLQVYIGQMLGENINETLDHTLTSIKIAREKGIVVAHCRMAFNDTESANLPETNPLLAKLANDPKFLASAHVDAETSQFINKVAPQEGDIVFRKNRVGPFQGKDENDFEAILKERGIDTIIVGGIATGGAVLATVVQAADLDYRLVVLEDCCFDPDPELHRTLTDKIFKKRGTVINSPDLEGLIEV